MKKLLITLMFLPVTTHAIVVVSHSHSHTEEAVNPQQQQKCDYSVAVDINKRVWRCFTAVEYSKYTADNDAIDQAERDRMQNELSSQLKNNYYLLPIGFVLLILCLIFGGMGDTAALLGVMSILIIFAGFIRALYQLAS